MLHTVPVLCLIFFVLFVELQLKKELHQIEAEFRELKKSILENKEKIQFNRDLIDTHQHPQSNG